MDFLQNVGIFLRIYVEVVIVDSRIIIKLVKSERRNEFLASLLNNVEWSSFGYLMQWTNFMITRQNHKISKRVKKILIELENTAALTRRGGSTQQILLLAWRIPTTSYWQNWVFSTVCQIVVLWAIHWGEKTTPWKGSAYRTTVRYQIVRLTNMCLYCFSILTWILLYLWKLNNAATTSQNMCKHFEDSWNRHNAQNLSL